jgi:lysozyme
MDRKPLFDLIRRLIRRAYRPSDVAQLDAALDEMLEHSDEVALPITSIGAHGIALIKRFEGCAKKRGDGMIEAYPDPASGGDPWTIGWGATGAGIAPGTVWTQAECDARLEADLVRYAAAVSRALGNAPTTQQQFDALVSFHYNTGAIARATLTKKHIAGDYPGAAAEFARWNMAAGKVMRGLVRRREAEARLYREG